MKALKKISLVAAFFVLTACSQADKYVEQGDAKIDLKDYCNALSNFNIALELSPNNSRIYFKRGDVNLI